MAVDWDALDYSDPCALVTVLEPAFYRLSVGDAEIEVQNETYRARFVQADLDRLGQLIGRLKQQCNRATGATRTRFAIRGRFACRPGG